MYLVTRFDQGVAEVAREAILESEFVSTILQDLYYTSPDGTVGVDAFGADTVDGTLMMAHDQRGAVTHATIGGTKLPKDVVYLLVAETATLFNTEEAVKAGVQPYDFVWESDAQRDAATVIQADIAELAVNIGYPHRATIFQIGEVYVLCAIWGGDAGELYMQSMQDSYNELRPTEGETCDECSS
jgi:hypothetical protein